MKALVYVEPRKLEFRDWPDPVFNPGEGVLRVQAVGVCGSDLHIWRGHSPKHVPPIVVGHELTGVLEKVGDDLSPLRAGDRVAVFPHLGCGECIYCANGQDPLCPRKKTITLNFGGAFCEFARSPIKNLYPLPAHVGFVEGALIEPLACAVHAVSKCGAERGPVAIMGAGPIGLLVLHVARQLGFPKVAVVEVSAHRLEKAREDGADLAVNPTDPGSLEELQNFFGKEGCLVAFDAVGLSATRQLALKLTRPKGLLVSIGIAEDASLIDFGEIISREIRLEGSMAYSRNDFELAVRWVSEGRLKLKSWISQASLSEGQAVFDDLASGNSSRIKAVLRP